jgi:hypothetical protein
LIEWIEKARPQRDSHPSQLGRFNIEELCSSILATLFHSPLRQDYVDVVCGATTGVLEEQRGGIDAGNKSGCDVNR